MFALDEQSAPKKETLPDTEFLRVCVHLCLVMCCDVLWCAVMCCDVLCCAVLCCTVLCCTELCCAMCFFVLHAISINHLQLLLPRLNWQNLHMAYHKIKIISCLLYAYHLLYLITFTTYSLILFYCISCTYWKSLLVKNVISLFQIKMNIVNKITSYCLIYPNFFYSVLLFNYFIGFNY